MEYELEELGVFAGRVFTEEYFIKKIGDGLPYEVYEILAKKANEEIRNYVSYDLPKNGEPLITRQKHLMNAVLKELSFSVPYDA